MTETIRPSERLIVSDGFVLWAINFTMVLKPPLGGWIFISDICHSSENLVLRTSVGFENPTYALSCKQLVDLLGLQPKLPAAVLERPSEKGFRRPAADDCSSGRSRSLENLVLRTSVGFESPTYALKPKS